MSDAATLLIITLVAILLLLLLVIRFKVHAFVALIIASMVVGLGTGMPGQEVLQSMQDGMGSILGFVAVIVGLGAIFGQILESSGGAEVLAHKMLKGFGEKRASWALTFSGFLICIPIFMDIAFIILVPVIYALSRKSKKSLVFYAVPLLAGMAVTHSFIPPTPGPVAVAQILDASMGWVIFFGFVIGVPTAILAGPVFGKYIGKKVVIAPPAMEELEHGEEHITKQPAQLPFFPVVALIGLPLVLIMASTIVDMSIKAGNLTADAAWVQVVQFLGHPFTALLLATFGAAYWLGIKNGFSAANLQKLADKALGPAGLIILVTGAGGMFKQILIDSGVGTALAETLQIAQSWPIVLAYILAVVLRLSQGSATVAMITSAGMIAPILEIAPISDPQKALIVIAIAAGASVFSHVNDSGFWLFSKYLYMTEKQTMKTWSIVGTIISVCGFSMALIISLLI